MSIENQIANHTNEPDEEYCPECEATMTLNHYAGINWLQCDNQECNHVIEEGE